MALGAISIHRSGLEAALLEPLQDPVFRESEVRFHAQKEDLKYTLLRSIEIHAEVRGDS